MHFTFVSTSLKLNTAGHSIFFHYEVIWIIYNLKLLTLARGCVA